MINHEAIQRNRKSLNNFHILNDDTKQLNNKDVLAKVLTKPQVNNPHTSAEKVITLKKSSKPKLDTPGREGYKFFTKNLSTDNPNKNNSSDNFIIKRNDQNSRGRDRKITPSNQHHRSNMAQPNNIPGTINKSAGYDIQLFNQVKMKNDKIKIPSHRDRTGNVINS